MSTNAASGPAPILLRPASDDRGKGKGKGKGKGRRVASGGASSRRAAKAGAALRLNSRTAGHNVLAQEFSGTALANLAALGVSAYGAKDMERGLVEQATAQASTGVSTTASLPVVEAALRRTQAALQKVLPAYEKLAVLEQKARRRLQIAYNRANKVAITTPLPSAVLTGPAVDASAAVASAKTEYDQVHMKRFGQALRVTKLRMKEQLLLGVHHQQWAAPRQVVVPPHREALPLTRTPILRVAE